MLTENKELKVLAVKVAEALLEIKAVFLRPSNPFTWASGIKSPIYCDNRLTLAYPKIRRTVENGLSEVVKTAFPDTECVMGTSTAGIPHAAIVSEILGLPMGYVRSTEKSHGRNNRIEGANPSHKKTIVIEDLISTAGSSIEVVNALRESEADVLGIVSIFSYNLQKGKERLAEADVKNISLCNIDVLTNVALQNGYISESEKKAIEAFIANPSDSAWQSLL